MEAMMKLDEYVGRWLDVPPPYDEALVRLAQTDVLVLASKLGAVLDAGEKLRAAFLEQFSHHTLAPSTVEALARFERAVVGVES